MLTATVFPQDDDGNRQRGSWAVENLRRAIAPNSETQVF
jgi:hypothetical protein